MLPMQTIGLDIGGANLKAASFDGTAFSQSFELWRAPDRLPAELRRLLAQFPPAEKLAVTMTAELADCFSTKAEGVAAILVAVSEVAGKTPVVVWQTTGEFVSVEQAIATPLQTAASNWQALATWSGQIYPAGRSLLIDIGSTTTDLIPIDDGKPCPRGLTDPQRLVTGELVYTGVRRTPLCALLQEVDWQGATCRVAAELFATMLDVFLLLGKIPENPEDTATADGRPATRAAAHNRLAHLLCCDRTELPLEDAVVIAWQFVGAQLRLLRQAVEQVVGEAENLSGVVISGSGSFLAWLLVKVHPRLRSARRIALAELLSPQAADAACAFAVAQLAEMCENNFSTGHAGRGTFYHRW